MITKSSMTSSKNFEASFPTNIGDMFSHDFFSSHIPTIYLFIKFLHGTNTSCYFLCYIFVSISVNLVHPRSVHCMVIKVKVTYAHEYALMKGAPLGASNRNISTTRSTFTSNFTFCPFYHRVHC